MFQKVFSGNVQSYNLNTVPHPNCRIENYITDQTRTRTQLWFYLVQFMIQIPRINSDSGNSTEQATESVDAKIDDLLQQMSGELEKSFQDLAQGIHKEKIKLCN